LEFSQSCGTSDSEAASTPRSDTDNLEMHGLIREARSFVAFAALLLPPPRKSGVYPMGKEGLAAQVMLKLS
jgi:hypothetical protein